MAECAEYLELPHLLPSLSLSLSLSLPLSLSLLLPLSLSLSPHLNKVNDCRVRYSTIRHSNFLQPQGLNQVFDPLIGDRQAVRYGDVGNACTVVTQDSKDFIVDTRHS